MSLINKMLQDLESRKNPQVEGAPKKSVYEDLKPIRKGSSPASSRRIAMLLAALVLVGGGAYAWMQWGGSLVASLFSDEVTAKSPSSMARKMPAPKPAPAPVSVPPPASVEKPAEPPVKVVQAQVAPPVAVAEQKKPEVPLAPDAPGKTATPAKAKSAAAVEAGYWTVSRGETLYGISVQTGIDLWDLSKWNGLGQEHVIQPGQRLRLTPTAQAKPAISQAKEEKTSPAEKQKTVVASAKPSEQKSELKAMPAEAPSARDSRSGHAVMDKKMKPLSSDEKAESEYRQAVDLLQKGRMTDAEKHLKLALKADETHTQTRELLAGLMLQQGHWRDAQQILEQGIGKVPKHYPFAQLLARVYVEHGADQKALAVMEQSREAAAANPDYVAFLAALYQRAGKHAEAVKTYTEAVTLNPQEGRWWLGLGISHEALQDWNTAANAYQHAVDSGALEDNLLKYARQRLAIVKNK